MLIKFILIFIGGGLGSCLRFVISYINPIGFRIIPFSTLIANCLASFILGIYFYKFKTSPEQTWVQYFIMLGFCGGLSTFSTFSGELMEYIWNNQFWNFLLYIFISIGICILCFYFGFNLKRFIN